MSWKDSIQEAKPASWKDSIKEPEAEPRGAMDISAEGLGRSLTEAIPIAGGAIGGIAGSVAGPVGSLGGAGAGYATGAQLRDMIKQYILKDKMESKGILGELKETGGDLLTGAGMEAGGMVAGKALQSAAPLIEQGVKKIPGLAGDLALDAVPFGNTAKRVISSVLKNRPKEVPSAGSLVDESVPLPQPGPYWNNMPNTKGAPSLPEPGPYWSGRPSGMGPSKELMPPAPGKPPMSGDEIFKVRRFKGDTGSSAPTRQDAIDHFLSSGSPKAKIDPETSGYYKDLGKFPEEPEYPVQDIFGTK